MARSSSIRKVCGAPFSFRSVNLATTPAVGSGLVRASTARRTTAAYALGPWSVGAGRAAAAEVEVPGDAWCVLVDVGLLVDDDASPHAPAAMMTSITTPSRRMH